MAEIYWKLQMYDIFLAQTGLSATHLGTAQMGKAEQMSNQVTPPAANTTSAKR